MTEPLKNVGMEIFTVVDFCQAYFFSKRFVNELYRFPKMNLNLLGFNCKIQDVPKIKESVFEQLKSLNVGSYLLKFSKLELSLEGIERIEDYDFSIGYISDYSENFQTAPINGNILKASISVFIHKRSDVNDDMLKRESTIICHHTPHTYGEFDVINPKGYEEVLYSSKELGTVQMLNLHQMDKKSLKNLRESIEKVGFDSITYCEVYSKGKRSLTFSLRTKSISPKEIEELRTGSYRWLVLKAS
jgi:hypothetical protein